MYTSNELEALSITFDSQMRQLEKDVMSDIIRRISINGEITRAADWQINRLIEMGVLREDIEKSIKHYLKMSDKEIEELFREAAESGYARNDEIYKKAGIKNIPFEENTVLQQLIAAVGKQTTEEMRNISQSLGFAVRNTDGSLSFKPIAEYYQDTLDNAVGGIANGVFDYNTAIKRAVSEMTKSGLRTVDYASGWSNRVDVAARRAVMTGFAQVTGKINEQNAEKLHTDTFEVTWHSGARPSHQEWQGKWYTHDELVSVCGLGTVTGLSGANCRHSYYPVIPGTSEPTYTAEELAEMNSKENIPTEYNGKKYTKYEALQRQRRLETTMRAQRQQIHLLKVGNADEDDIIAARCRYRVTSQEYKRFSEAMQLPEQRQRVTVDGLGNIGQGKWKKSVDKTGQSGIINKYKGKGIEVISDYDISNKTIEKVKKATKRISKDFKVLENYSEPITFGDVIGGLAQNHYDEKTGLNHIVLRKIDFANPEELIKVLKRDFELGKSYKTKHIESLVAHEMGHNLHIILALRKAKLLYGVQLTPELVVELENSMIQIRNEVYDYVFGDMELDEIISTVKKDLGWSATVGNELIAQSFGNYYYGDNKSKIARKVIKYFKKELK